MLARTWGSGLCSCSKRHAPKALRAEVHAFEPVPKVYEELVRRVAADPDGARVSCVPECVGSEPGTASMQLAEGLAGSHSMVREQGAAADGVIEVRVTTLSDYCAAKGIGHVTS